MTQTDGNIQRAWSLMKDIGIAMVVTHDGHFDELRARPMAAHPDAGQNAIYFLTDAKAAKDRAVESNDHVCLTFSDIKEQQYVSVTGHADVLDDRAIVTRIWSASDKALWKDENDPNIRVFRVVPSAAEYWEGAGMIASFVKMAAAKVTGSNPKLHENGKVLFTPHN